MNPFDDLIAHKTPSQLQEWKEPVKRSGRDLNARRQEPVKGTVRALIDPSLLAPSMDSMCVCGLRYGMHRVNDFACMNQQWRPGNGQPQWLTKVFQRGTAA